MSDGPEQDAKDMAQLAAGHESALNNLMDRHGPRLFGYLVRSLQNEDDAADLAQETFVRIYQNRARFDPRQKFTTWLYSIASNLVRDRYRWRSRHPQVSLDAQNLHTSAGFKESLVAPDVLPDQALQSGERADAVRKAVRELPDDLKQPLILSVYENLPQAEIAAILGCSIKAVEMRIYRARQQLRSDLTHMLC